MTLDELKELHALIIMFEDNKLQASAYFESVNKITGLKLTGCNTCGAYNAKQHNDVQIYFWQKVSEHAPDYLPKTPLFKLSRLNSPYYQEQIAKWSFNLMKNNIESLKTERDRQFQAKKDKDLYDMYQSDIDTLTDLLKAKRVFSEYEEHIETSDLVRLKDAGWTTTLIAERLGVNPETVRKRIKIMELGASKTKHDQSMNENQSMSKHDDVADKKTEETHGIEVDGDHGIMSNHGSMSDKTNTPSKKTRKKKEVNDGQQGTD